MNLSLIKFQHVLSHPYLNRSQPRSIGSIDALYEIYQILCIIRPVFVPLCPVLRTPQTVSLTIYWGNFFPQTGDQFVAV